MKKRELKNAKSAKKGEKSARSADGEATGRRRFPSRLAGVLLVVVAVVFLVYSLISLIGIRSKIKELRQDLAEVTTEMANQERRNDEMAKIANRSGDELAEYMEQIAHDTLDLVYEGERIFIVVSGD